MLYLDEVPAPLTALAAGQHTVVSNMDVTWTPRRQRAFKLRFEFNKHLKMLLKIVKENSYTLRISCYQKKSVNVQSLLLKLLTEDQKFKIFLSRESDWRGHSCHVYTQVLFYYMLLLC